LYEIRYKETLSAANRLMVVDAPAVARKARAGQFVIVRVDTQGERIPLTIADYDRRAGTITLIFQEVGKSTLQMGRLEAGDCLANVAGPLGVPSEVDRYGTVVCVAGGVGIAPMFPITRELKEAGNRVISILGARSSGMLFWEDRMAAVSDQLLVCTDDGSRGRQGLVTQLLDEVLAAVPGGIARVWAIGPAVMMKFVSQTTRPHGVPTIVSLNTIMVDGTGMCGGCRVLLAEGARFVCVDGPEFDGHQVDWDNLLARQAYYREEEQAAVTHWEHQCRLTGATVQGEG
jgi:ferredoxin--NADP+ reductase